MKSSIHTQFSMQSSTHMDFPVQSSKHTEFCLLNFLGLFSRILTSGRIATTTEMECLTMRKPSPIPRLANLDPLGGY